MRRPSNSSAREPSPAPIALSQDAAVASSEDMPINITRHSSFSAFVKSFQQYMESPSCTPKTLINDFCTVLKTIGLGLSTYYMKNEDLRIHYALTGASVGPHILEGLIPMFHETSKCIADKKWSACLSKTAWTQFAAAHYALLITSTLTALWVITEIQLQTGSIPEKDIQAVKHANIAALCAMLSVPALIGAIVTIYKRGEEAQKAEIAKQEARATSFKLDERNEILGYMIKLRQYQTNDAQTELKEELSAFLFKYKESIDIREQELLIEEVPAPLSNNSPAPNIPGRPSGA